MIYYGTFGVAHPLGGNYVKFEADNFVDARQNMIRVYGARWSHVYPDDMYEAAIAPYDLREVPFGTPNTHIIWEDDPESQQKRGRVAYVKTSAVFRLVSLLIELYEYEIVNEAMQIWLKYGDDEK